MDAEGSETAPVLNSGSASDASPAVEPPKDPSMVTKVPPVIKLAKAPALFFLENPDGTITEAMLPISEEEQKEKSLPGGQEARRRAEREAAIRRQLPMLGEADAAAAATMLDEVDFLYTRHERVLILLLLVQFLIEVLYNGVYITHMDVSIAEILALYNWRLSAKWASIVFWSIFVVQVSYSIVYYIIACLAIQTKRPRAYRLFASWSLLGIAFLVLLAYIDKFNLLIFFLRLLAYIYGRFLQGLTASLMLLPQPLPA